MFLVRDIMYCKPGKVRPLRHKGHQGHKGNKSCDSPQCLVLVQELVVV